MDIMILQLNNVSKIFSDGTKALDDVSFSVDEGEFIVLAGRNGSGKSVLMSIIAKLEKATSGNVIAESAGLIFQDADSQILGETPEEDISFGLRNSGLKKNEVREKCTEILRENSLYEKRSSPARSLSGGEKRRLAVASVMALNRKIIIFDEPFANLDFPGVQQVCNLLKKLKSEKRTVIILTHEVEKILALADRFIILEKGKVQFDGSPSDGLSLNLEQFGIRNPLAEYKSLTDLFWGSE